MSDDSTDDTFDITRERMLAGLGAIGAASAAAGLGTTALLSGEEQFTNNALNAGTLNLRVSTSVVAASDYFTADGDGPNVVGRTWTADGAVRTGIQVSDIKPGDWLLIEFAVSVEGNPGYVDISAEQFAQYENGQTESEAAVDESAGGSLGLPFDGRGLGELQDAMRAELYDEYTPSDGGDPPRSYVSGRTESVGGTVRQAFDRVAAGVVRGGRDAPIEVGPDNSPITRYLLLELPETVGNEIQSDSVAFDVVFGVEQSRHNDPRNAAVRSVGTTKLTRGGTTTVTLSLDLQRETSLDVLERFDTNLRTATLDRVGVDDERIEPTFVEFDTGGGAVLVDALGPGAVSATYTLQISDDAPTGTYRFTPNEVDVGGIERPVEGVTEVDVTE